MRLHCQFKSLELRKIKSSDETGVTIPLNGLKKIKGWRVRAVVRLGCQFNWNESSFCAYAS